MISAAVLAPHAEAQRQGLVFGAGTVGCGVYLQDRANRLTVAEHQYAQWAWGYMASYNSFSTQPQVPLVEESTLLAYLDKFCRDNPLNFVADGVNSLIAAKGGWPYPRKAEEKRK